MLHTKFRGNRPTGSGEEDCLKGFYHIWAWRPSWSCDQNIANKISMPLPKEATHKLLHEPPLISLGTLQRVPGTDGAKECTE